MLLPPRYPRGYPHGVLSHAAGKVVFDLFFPVVFEPAGFCPFAKLFWPTLLPQLMVSATGALCLSAVTFSHESHLNPVALRGRCAHRSCLTTCYHRLTLPICPAFSMGTRTLSHVLHFTWVHRHHLLFPIPAVFRPVFSSKRGPSRQLALVVRLSSLLTTVFSLVLGSSVFSNLLPLSKNAVHVLTLFVPSFPMRLPSSHLSLQHSIVNQTAFPTTAVIASRFATLWLRQHCLPLLVSQAETFRQGACRQLRGHTLELRAHKNHERRNKFSNSGTCLRLRPSFYLFFLIFCVLFHLPCSCRPFSAVYSMLPSSLLQLLFNTIADALHFLLCSSVRCLLVCFLRTLDFSN